MKVVVDWMVGDKDNPHNHLRATKAIRDVTGMSIVDSKELVDRQTPGVPFEILSVVSEKKTKEYLFHGGIAVLSMDNTYQEQNLLNLRKKLRMIVTELDGMGCFNLASKIQAITSPKQDRDWVDAANDAAKTASIKVLVFPPPSEDVSQ